MSVCVRERDRQTDRETDRQTDRQKETDRQTDRQPETEREGETVTNETDKGRERTGTRKLYFRRIVVYFQ